MVRGISPADVSSTEPYHVTSLYHHSQRLCSNFLFDMWNLLHRFFHLSKDPQSSLFTITLGTREAGVRRRQWRFLPVGNTTTYWVSGRKWDTFGWLGVWDSGQFKRLDEGDILWYITLWTMGPSVRASLEKTTQNRRHNVV